MKMISEYKKELIVGLIFICLQPIFNYIGNQLVKLFISINTLYSENYYKSIAINNENEFSQSNSFFLSYILIFILLIKDYVRKPHSIRIKVENFKSFLKPKVKRK